MKNFKNIYCFTITNIFETCFYRYESLQLLTHQAKAEKVVIILAHDVRTSGGSSEKIAHKANWNKSWEISDPPAWPPCIAL